MSDPEVDRVQYLLQRRVDCELTEAEQHELALYDGDSVERVRPMKIHVCGFGVPSTLARGRVCPWCRVPFGNLDRDEGR